MSEQIELEAEVHSESVDKEDSQERETAIEQKNTATSESVGHLSGGKDEPVAEEPVASSESQPEDRDIEQEKESDKDQERIDKRDGEDKEEDDSKAKEEGESSSQMGEEAAPESKERPENEEQQHQNDDKVIQQEPTS